MKASALTGIVVSVAIMALAGIASGEDALVEKDKVKDKDKPSAEKSDKEKVKPGTIQVATFGGGCFWCTEAVCEQIPGVKSVTSGYSGGNTPFPTYEAVLTGMTGHAEVVQVVFDAYILPYEKLLEVFFRSHDPTTPNAQGPDFGTQYRSIILYHNESQRKAAQATYEALKARRILKGTVVTQLVPFQAFFPAEAYHQDYYSNHPSDPYSVVFISPKFDVFRKMMKGTKPAKPTPKALRTAKLRQQPTAPKVDTKPADSTPTEDAPSP